jgi:oxygen-independent coproporphyrinogen-3 oxidase
MSEKLTKAGYLHYEISNFAKPGRMAQHNLRYWRNEETVGVGISSASYINGSRFKNSGSFPAYLERAVKRLPPERTEERLSSDEKIREDAMLALRLSEGMDLAELKKLDLPLLDVFLDRGLAKLEGTRFVFTPEGWLISNQLFQHLVS